MFAASASCAMTAPHRGFCPIAHVVPKPADFAAPDRGFYLVTKFKLTITLPWIRR
jgi:hypothetical protein